MTQLSSHLQRARAAAAKAAHQRAQAQLFSLVWRSGAAAVLQGFDTLSAAINLSVPTIRTRLSQGSGAFTVTRANPETGEPDLLTVTRIVVDKPKPRRGRPPKYPKTDLA